MPDGGSPSVIVPRTRVEHGPAAGAQAGFLRPHAGHDPTAVGYRRQAKAHDVVAAQSRLLFLSGPGTGLTGYKDAQDQGDVEERLRHRIGPVSVRPGIQFGQGPTWNVKDTTSFRLSVECSEASASGDQAAYLMLHPGMVTASPPMMRIGTQGMD